MTARREAGRASAAAEPGDRADLMKKHREATARRDAASLESDEFRAAAQEVARIEVAIARLEEPGARDL